MHPVPLKDSKGAPLIDLFIHDEVEGEEEGEKAGEHKVVDPLDRLRDAIG